MKVKLGDIIIIFVILVLAMLLFSLDFSGGNTVFVEVDGEVIKTLSLEKNAEFVHEGKYTNIIRVKDGAVSIAESDCPDNTCVHTGKIKSSQKVICCLPNKLIVRIVKKDKSGTDVISG